MDINNLSQADLEDIASALASRGGDFPTRGVHLQFFGPNAANKSGRSSKFWCAVRIRNWVLVQYGSLRTAGRGTVHAKRLDTAEAAEVHLAQKVTEKIRKGYFTVYEGLVEVPEALTAPRGEGHGAAAPILQDALVHAEMRAVAAA